jgi:integrase
MNLKAARRRIWQMRAMMSHGENPADWKMRQRGTPTFRQFVEEQYLPYCKATVTRPDVVISRLNSGALPLFGERPLDCISRADVQQFHAAMRLKLCPTSANHHLMCVKRIFNLAVQWEVVGKNPAAGVKKLPQPAGRNRFLSREETRRFLEALDASPHVVSASSLRFLLFTGFRMGEGLSIAWRDVDSELRAVYLRHTKSGNSRRVYLCTHAWSEIERMLGLRQGDHPFVFPGRRPNTSLAQPRICFWAALKEAGVSDFKIHDLRHTMASYMVQSGSTLFEVQKQLGHTTPLMTQRYAHLCDIDIRDRTEAAVNYFKAGGLERQGKEVDAAP